MKTTHCTRFTAALATAILLAAAPARAQTPARASVSLAPAAGGLFGNLTINDPGDNVWNLESSTDLGAWSFVKSYRIYNGAYTVGLTTDPAQARLFYRAVYDPSAQGLPYTTSDALKLPVTAYNYAHPALPPSYLAPPVVNQDNTPATNPTTDLGATLGRVLFYDKRLSTNRTVACASCHQAQHGFSDPRKVSAGFDGSQGNRHAMRLVNARYYQRGHFFWDERANALEDQVLGPIQNPVEMGMTLPTLITRLSAETFYTNLFNQTFGSPVITTNRISQALAQFVRSMVSYQSKYDQGLRVGFTNFTAQESLGRQIFLGQVGRATCAACHGTDSFTAPNIFNNGLEFPYVDTGVGGVTGVAQQMGLFKVPSLRNIEVSGPYMHDGRFKTLEEVVDFYNSGVVDNPNLSPPLRTPPGPGVPPGAPLRLNLSTDQKAALVAFLKTLTDTTLATDPKYQDPFNYGK